MTSSTQSVNDSFQRMTFSSIKTITAKHEYEYITQVDEYFSRHTDYWHSFKAAVSKF